MFEYQNLKGYMFLFWGMFWTHGSFLVEYIKVHKKIEMIWWTFGKEKELLKLKKPHVHMFFLSALNIYSWNMVLCSCNFESIRTYFKN
jgi:hypothetical protein